LQQWEFGWPDTNTRYHVGESMLPSMRHFLKFIGAYEKWDAHGFNIKVTTDLL
jgi:hypothetical protein